MRRWAAYFVMLVLLTSTAGGFEEKYIGKEHFNLSGEEWSRRFGSFFFPDLGHTIREYSDGYIVGGMTIRFPYLEQYGWLLKLDKEGKMEWSKIMKDMEDLMDVEVVDGIIAGGYGKDGDLKLVKMDFYGNIIWEKSYGGNYLDILKKDGCISLTEDGGYVVLSTTWSFSNDKGADMWILKLDENGKKEWEKVYGKLEDADIGYGVMEVENGYIIVGQSFSFNHTEYGIVIKLDRNGNVEWEKRIGYAIMDVVAAGNSSFIITGSMFNEERGKYEVMVAKMKDNGEFEWLKFYRSDTNAGGYSIDMTDDGKFWVCGNVDYKGNEDIWLLKIDKNGNEVWNATYGKAGWDRGECIRNTEDGGCIVAGSTTSFPWLFFPYRLNMWVIKIGG